MEINEKKHKKEQQELIIRKYQQYLKLEKSLSLNTLDAYLTDLDKLMSFLTLEGIYVLDVWVKLSSRALTLFLPFLLYSMHFIVQEV